MDDPATPELYEMMRNTVHDSFPGSFSGDPSNPVGGVETGRGGRENRIFENFSPANSSVGPTNFEIFTILSRSVWFYPQFSASNNVPFQF